MYAQAQGRNLMYSFMAISAQELVRRLLRSSGLAGRPLHTAVLD